MKISRRGKQARRGRHTKRTGKHLRYKSKKFRASKRYHRGNKRTYKRGKRFHRGGEVRVDGGKIDKKKPGVVIDLSNTTNITDADITENNIAFYPEGYKKWFSTRNSMYYGNVMDRGNSDRQGGYEFTFNSLNSGAYVIQFNNVPLVFTKEGFFTGTKAPGKFKVVIIEEKPFEDPNDTRTKALRKFRAILIRQDENIGKYDNDGFSLEVHFRNLESNNLNDFKSMLINTTNLQKLESNHDKKYNFNYTENIKYFELFSKAADVLSVYVEAQFMAQQQIRDEEESKSKEIKLEKTRKAEEATEEFDKNGDNVEVFMRYQTSEDFSPTKDDKEMKLTFSDFKKELEELAKKTKEKIETNEKIGQTEKIERNKRVDDILKTELRDQRVIMRENYIAEKAGYDIKQSIGGKMSLLDQTSNRVNENLKSKNQIIDQANEYSEDWNDYDRQTGQLTRKPLIKNEGYSNTKTVKLTSGEAQFYEHHGIDPERLNQSSSGPTDLELGRKPF